MRDHQHAGREPDRSGARAPATTARRVQRALQVGAADDPLEREADRVAEEVLSSLRSLRGAPAGPPAMLGADGADASRIRRSTAAPPTRRITSRPGGAVVIRRVPVKWVAGVDPDKPSTYDQGGGHSYADHGAHTTKQQHVTRVRTGVAPSGRESRVPKGKPSSKFASDSKHVEAFKAAAAGLTEKNKTKTKIRGDAEKLTVADAGTLIYGDEREVTTSTVRLDIVPVDDTTLRVNSMYPTE